MWLQARIQEFVKGGTSETFFKGCLKVNFHIFNVQSWIIECSHASCLFLWAYQEGNTHRIFAGRTSQLKKWEIWIMTVTRWPVFFFFVYVAVKTPYSYQRNRPLESSMRHCCIRQNVNVSISKCSVLWDVFFSGDVLLANARVMPTTLHWFDDTQ